MNFSIRHNSFRELKNSGLTIGIIALSTLTVIPLLLIIYEVVAKGWQQISFHFFTEATPNSLDAMLAIGNKQPIPGGIANGIVGTLIMVSLASVVAIPIGIMCGIYLSEHKHSKFASAVRFLANILQGTPSIIIGIVAYLWIVVPTRSYSALAGGASLAIMMLPLIVRSTEETLNMLPTSLKEASLALGARYSTTVLHVLLPSAFGGVFTGILLAISRVAGETAPLMLTALGSSVIQWNLNSPNSAVPLLIWEFYNDPNLQQMIWSASLFLLAFILTLNILAKQISKRWKI